MVVIALLEFLIGLFGVRLRLPFQRLGPREAMATLLWSALLLPAFLWTRLALLTCMAVLFGLLMVERLWHRCSVRAVARSRPRVRR